MTDDGYGERGGNGKQSYGHSCCEKLTVIISRIPSERKYESENTNEKPAEIPIVLY